MKKIYLFLSMFLCVAMAQAQTNIMAGYNGGFETGDLTGWRFYENESNIGGTCVITTSAHSGTKAAKITFLITSSKDRALDNWDTKPPVVASKVYELKTWLKSDNPSGFKVKVTFGYFDESGTFLGSSDLIRSVTTTYKEYSFQTLAPPTATSCFMAFRLIDPALGPNSKAAGTLYVDDVQLYQLQTNSFNALNSLNGNFELGTIDNWRFVELGPSSPISTANISSTDAHSGRYAANITWGQSAAITELLFDQYLNITPGVTYTYSAWAKSLSGPFILQISSAFIDASSKVISTSQGMDKSWILSADYTQHSFVLPTAPPEATRLNIGFRAFNADGSRWPATDVECLIDDVQLNQPLTSNPSALSMLHQVPCQIYPNPATEYINIQSSNKLQSASIYSISGQKVKDINSKFDNINISDLLSGIYFVKVNADGVDSTQKLVIK